MAREIVRKPPAPGAASAARVAREVERERHERILHDEMRTGLAPPDDLRTKDARVSSAAVNLKRLRR